jgi:hypothetical protein
MFEINIKDIRVRYHRNGIGGEGFFAINFTAYSKADKKEDDCDKQYDGKLICVIIPGSEDDEKGQYRCNGQCFIIKPTRPDLCFRGDNFEPYMRDILKAYELEWQRIIALKNGSYLENCTFKDMKEVSEIINPKTKPKPEPTTKRMQRFQDIIN